MEKKISWILGFVGLIWVVELINFFMNHSLCKWGILPRTVSGLPGILFSPFLHASIPHLLLNTVPLAILGGGVMLRGKKIFFEVSFFIIIISGMVLWLFGRSSYHVGASGLIFGYFGYLVLRGWYDKSVTSLVIACITFSFYGSILWGLLPGFYHISWEGHLFGLIAGGLGARIEKT